MTTDCKSGLSRLIFPIRVYPRSSAALVPLLVVASALAQQAHTTVRHHTVAENAAPAVKPEVTQAEAALDKQDYTAAEPLLRKATEADAKDFRAWFDLGLVYIATNRRNEAIDAYRRSVASDAGFFESNFNLGTSLAAAGDNAEAEKYLRAATRLKPFSNPKENLQRAWLALGEVAARSKNTAGALDAFHEAEQLEPKNAQPHLQAAIALEQAGNLTEAEREFTRAAQLDPKSKEALAGIVNVNMRAKRLPEAEAALRNFLAADPQNATAHLQLGRVLAAEKKDDEAAQEIDVALKLQPGDADAMHELASLHASAKQYDKAAAEYATLVEREPNNGDLHFAYGTVLMDKHDYPAAERELIAAAKLKGGADVFGNLAVVAAENKNYPLVIQALDARAKIAPENAGTYFLRATTLDHLQEATHNPQFLKQAVENYKQFLTASNGHNPDDEWKARHRLIALEPKK